jgi:hypothetical protein
MPGTQAQNVRWVALDEQVPPARTGVPVALGLALPLALPLAAAVVPPPDELEELEELEPPPLLHAASTLAAARPASAAAANRVVLLRGFPFDNIWGSFAGLLSSLVFRLGERPSASRSPRREVSG